jgi:tetratricopeptide (TPR) repeat protein
MPARPRRTCLCLLALCCAPLTAGAGEEPASTAVRAWEEGQEAMRLGQSTRAIAAFRRSLELDPTLSRSHLSLAAAYVGEGNDPEAAEHLGAYVRAEPGHVTARRHYAELLLRLGRYTEGRAQLERFVADCQEQEDLAEEHLVGGHSRLMEAAETQEDEYGEHLHRGIGLFLLACRRAAGGEAPDGLPAEALLFKAAGELTLAHMERPGEARPCWYLHGVWEKLGQRQPAARWLRAARDAAVPGGLTPAEEAELRLAGRTAEKEAGALRR